MDIIVAAFFLVAAWALLVAVFAVAAGGVAIVVGFFAFIVNAIEKRKERIAYDRLSDEEKASKAKWAAIFEQERIDEWETEMALKGYL